MEWNSRAGTQAQPGQRTGTPRRVACPVVLRATAAACPLAHHSPVTRALPYASVESSVWSRDGVTEPKEARGRQRGPGDQQPSQFNVLITGDQKAYSQFLF